MNELDDRPIKRSKLRLFLGRIYFYLKKRNEWRVNVKNYGKIENNSTLPYIVFEHSSTLLRKLEGVDPQLQINKIQNLNIAIKKINGVLLKPGETFSYWKSIGRPTKSKGYLDGVILHDGKVLQGTGGGLCQLSNLIFWTTLHSPLTVTERWRHSYDVFPDSKRTQPFGSGATCAYPNIDLQIKNETNSNYQLKLWVTDKHLHGAWFSNSSPEFYYKIEEKNHKISSSCWGGYLRENEIWRKTFKQDGLLLTEELLVKNQAKMMYNPLINNDNS